MRCTAQKPKDQVAGCVDAEIAKLPWLPYYAYTWGGQSQCEDLASIFISITFDILALVCHAIGTIYLARRKGEPPPSFSFVSMWGMVLTGFCKPIAEGFLLNAMSPAPGFSMGPYLLPFLRPTGFALAAFISGVWGSRGWGLMYLFMDGVVTMLTFFAFNLRIDIWKGPAVVPSLGSIVTAGSLPPPQLPTVYGGLFVATLPGALFVAAYFLAGLWPTMVLVGCCTKTWSLVKLGFAIWLTWVCFFLMIFTSPFLAIWEMVWKKCSSKEKRFGRFPAVGWYAKWFRSSEHPRLRLVGVYGYLLWVSLQFAVFVGRWMVLANLLPLAGDAWCPGLLRDIEAGSALSTIFLVAGLLGLKSLNLTL
ncbi:hypothetical protein N656DRAFT_780432 [Canariomyces notabilis]|uniref:Uncharacterized protein n=1 Tax=Canariomyces notabilis TaxID=2074819 RepID=A0AAN6TCC8_9PEZI|nr:hypothetical protein N656DRAFT_780432 [Canariomyces arenarius]